MKTASRLLPILAIIGAVCSGVFYFLSKDTASDLEAILAQTRQQLAAVELRANKLNEEVSATNAERQAQGNSLEEARAKITALTTRNEQLKRETRRFTAELDDRIASEERLQKEVARLGREKAELESTTVSIDEIADYERKISRLEAEILNLQETRKGFPGSTAGTIATKPPSDLRGKILTVGAESSFIIINLGYDSGIRLETPMSIERGSETVAHAEITEVKENLSIARILPETLKLDLKPGDVVKTL